MQGNDLSSAPTSRGMVVSDVFLNREDHADEERRLFRSMFRKRSIVVPDLAVLSQLWRWSSAQGVRLEALFIGSEATDAVSVWDMLDRSTANPFTDWHVFENYSSVAHVLPFRPDVLWIVDIPARTAIYGGKGITVEHLR